MTEAHRKLSQSTNPLSVLLQDMDGDGSMNLADFQLGIADLGKTFDSGDSKVACHHFSGV